jgi:hypothetical protein
MKRIALIIVTVLMSFTSLHSQDNYYWDDGEQIYLEPYHKKKYIVVDSTITSVSELIDALNDPSLTVNTFQESSVLIHLNIYDSTLYEKQYAILQSQDSIDETALENNPVVNYVGPYYNGGTRGISRLFYVKLNQESDIALLDSMANSHNVIILGNDTYMPLYYTIECTGQSTGNALEMANLFYESNNFEHSFPDLMGSVEPVLVNLKECGKIIIYPNPVKDYISIDRKCSNLRINEIILYSMSGKKLKTFSPDCNNLNINELPAGFYILSISTENNIFTYKIIKK